NELIVADGNNAQVDIFQGLSNGGYSTTPTKVLRVSGNFFNNEITAMAVAPVTSFFGGLPDIVVADGLGNQITVFSNTNVGAGGNSPSGVVNPTGIAVGNFDQPPLFGFGLPDLAVSGRTGAGVLINNTKPPAAISFANSVFLGGATNATSIATGEFSSSA